jgi:hypothetical protein
MRGMYVLGISVLHHRAGTTAAPHNSYCGSPSYTGTWLCPKTCHAMIALEQPDAVEVPQELAAGNYSLKLVVPGCRCRIGG